jgi:hypothetical protein
MEDVACRNAYKIPARKPESKRQLERVSHRWQDNIKIDFRKEDGVVWTG